MEKRIDYIDWLKGFTIFLVVMGHCWLTTDNMVWLIYRFHMPMFFMLSGYLFNKKYDFESFVQRKVKKIIVPYFLFIAFALMVSIVFLGYKKSIFETIQYVLLGSKYLTYIGSWALWFLPVLFLSSIILYGILQIKNTVFYVVIIIGLWLLSVMFTKTLYGIFPTGFIPYAIQALPLGVAYMMFGYLLRRLKYKGTLVPGNVMLNAFLSVSLGLVAIYFTLDSRDVILSTKGYYFFPMSILIVHFVIFVTKGNTNKVFIYLGKNSLYILGMHRVLLEVARKALPINDILKENRILGDAAAIIVSILVIATICLLIGIFRFLKTALINSKQEELENDMQFVA